MQHSYMLCLSGVPGRPTVLLPSIRVFTATFVSRRFSLVLVVLFVEEDVHVLQQDGVK